MVLVEWVWELEIVRVMVKGCVRGNSGEGRILTGMVACQAHSQGRQNLTPLDSQCVALFHPETGQQQLLTCHSRAVLIPNKSGIRDGNFKDSFGLFAAKLGRRMEGELPEGVSNLCRFDGV